MKEKISMQLLLASYMHIPEPMAEPILKDKRMGKAPSFPPLPLPQEILQI